ncbi:putative inorganic carbon transporter subunit DabA [Nibricoccus sp. IMCC34717]|uniref:putative inorganic carbon transporter subunit DabA n=1 Tax=Nibricoccus sp. IMCC34717 TaxID=3034021 RepID=UPI00384B03C4
MNSSTTLHANIHESALERATQVVPPLFPLRHFVAVNPYLGYASTEMATAAVEMAATQGATLWMPGRYYSDLFSRGEVVGDDLTQAQAKLGSAFTLDHLLSWANREPKANASLPTYASFLDAAKPGAAWEHWVACQIGQFCGAYYDVNQATWPMPWRHLPLLEAWREYAAHDASPEVAGLSAFRKLVSELPDDTAAAVTQLAEALRPPAVPLDQFLIREITSLPGWAGYVQFRVRENSLRGRTDDSLKQFLVIRLAYDLGLKRAFATEELDRRWARTVVPAQPTANDAAVAQVWQTACEVAYQRRLVGKLLAPIVQPTPALPALQVVFCIDVRSERFRRHLERVEPTVQTLGFAGFFGVPVQFTDPATGEQTSRVPALFAPKLNTGLAAPDEQRIISDRELTRAWQGFQHAAASCFTYVESFGLGAITGAFRTRPKPKCDAAVPQWNGVSFEDRLAIAEGAIRGMGLDRHFAPLIVICGHGSSNVNNPQASALECGACGGHAGDHNARLAAKLLNDVQIRVALLERGIRVPTETVFVAGIHNTTTDEIELFEDTRLGIDSAARVAMARQWFSDAGILSRAERDGSLGHAGNWDERSLDEAETRPEFGLANNAAILLAPRAISRGKNLSARVFLHDYDHSRDTSLDQLVFLLSAPGVVASWINLQYYASRVDPDHHGSGNKVLHNVCGGIGVVEGNAGDIRPGLAWQSLHDGNRFVHEPLRLSIVAAAPRASLDAALQRAESALTLVRNNWIHLIALEGGVAYARKAEGTWLALPSAGND